MSVILYAAILALVHILASQFRLLSVEPRSRWLSAAGGIAVAYVFIHIFPELKEMQEIVEAHLEGRKPGFIDSHVYLISLVGLTVFYGLERMARVSRKKNTDGTEERTSPKVFWIHIISFGVYNILVGYLLVSGERTELGHFLFFVALALHFLTNDYGMWYHHKDMYVHKGRWLLAATVIVGWLLGVTIRLPEISIAVLFSFLAGGIIMNVLKEELPEERKSNFWAFLAGVAGYAGFLMLGSHL